MTAGYRCQTCRADVPPGQPRLVHAVRRADGTTTRELAVCARCMAFLAPTQAEPVDKTTGSDSEQELIPTGDD